MIDTRFPQIFEAEQVYLWVSEYFSFLWFSICIFFKKLEVFNEEWTRFNIHILIRMFFAWYNIYNIYIRQTVFLQALQEWGEGVRSFPSAGNPRGPQTVWICW